MLFSIFKPSFLLVTLPSYLCFPPGPFRDCLEAQEAGHSTTGMYLIKPDELERPVQVWCEQDIDNGGWTVIQSRRDGSVNFFRNWDNYKVMTIRPPRPYSLVFPPFFLGSAFEHLALPETTVVLLFDPSRGTIWGLWDNFLSLNPCVFTYCKI